MPEVNPRACGGDLTPECKYSAEQGQSPRVRGRLFHYGGNPIILRSIPARAGETWRILLHERLSRVNPRACGGDPSAQRRLLRVE